MRRREDLRFVTGRGRYVADMALEGALHRAFVRSPHAHARIGAIDAEVEIDPETGATRIVSYVCVDDVGTVINPMVVEGQVHGAAAQGIGQALFEAVAYDRATGQPYTGSFTDYALPRADTLPAFVSETDETQAGTHNPLGAKGCGESWTIGAPAAITSAMRDALAPLGVRDIAMPFTQENVWRAIRPARASG